MEDRLDPRHSQIREGAGLEQSRLNQDLIEFLKRWGAYFLLGLALLLLIYNGRGLLERRKAERRAQAFADLAAQTSGGSPNPAVLERIAEEYPRVAGIPVQARTLAADIYLGAAVLGVRWDFELGDNQMPTPESMLGEDERNEYLSRAAALYERVLKDAPETVGATVQRVGALFGLAAVAESRGEADAARQRYEQAAKVAEEAGYPELAGEARRRMEGIGMLANPPALVAEGDLPPLPEPEPGQVNAPGGGQALGLPPGLTIEPMSEPPAGAISFPAPTGDDAPETEDEPQPAEQPQE